MNTVLYIRVSTDEQVREGYSIPAQKERLEAFVKSQGWTIVDCYIEEGQSAKDLTRPEIQRLISNIKSGNPKIDIVLVYRLDRLTRSVLDLYELLKLFDKHNIAFRSATEVYDTTTAMGRLFITLVAALAQWERENLAERVRIGLAEMVRQGHRPGSAEPYGYTYREDGKLAINQVEAGIVKKIFELYNSGMGIRKITRWLNDHNIPTKMNKKWADKTVITILTNPLYIGNFAWGRPGHTRTNKKLVEEEFIHPGEHEPIIDTGTWETAQSILKRRKSLPPRTVTNNYPLTGLLVCGDCGGPVYGITSTRRRRNGEVTGKKRYYICSNRDRTTTCDLPYLDAEKLENDVLNYIDSFDDDELRLFIEKNKNEMKITDSEVEHLNSELKEIENKKRKWFDAYEAGAIDVNDLKDRTKSIESRLSFIRERLTELENVPSLTTEEMIQKLKNLKWYWEKANHGEKKEMLFSVFKEVRVFSDKTFEVILLD